jgi:hypothetical protein
MEVVFTYLPIRLKEVTEIYLKYSITNLNYAGITPIIYSDKDYFVNSNLEYKWIEFNVDDKYKKDSLWSYPKLKVLSNISFPFIHLDNDLIVNNFIKIKNIIDKSRLNLCYKHPLSETQSTHFNEIYKVYSDKPLMFVELNNTSIVCCNDYLTMNKAYLDVLDIIDLHYTFFSKKYNGIPPITLNQQYLNLYFNNINYLFSENPSFENMNKNGVCHLAEKNMVSNFVLNKKMI